MPVWEGRRKRHSCSRTQALHQLRACAASTFFENIPSPGAHGRVTAHICTQEAQLALVSGPSRLRYSSRTVAGQLKLRGSLLIEIAASCLGVFQIPRATMKINQELMKSLKINDDELKELKEAFVIFDQDKSGFIEPQELRHILQVLGQNPTKAEIDGIIAEADVIVIDGKIDFNEFARIMKKNYKFKSASEMDHELMSAFQVFDRDSNGFISRQELEFVLTSIGERMTSQEVDEMFKFADTDEDGKISYKEFVVLFNHSFKAATT